MCSPAKVLGVDPAEAQIERARNGTFVLFGSLRPKGTVLIAPADETLQIAGARRNTSSISSASAGASVGIGVGDRVLISATRLVVKVTEVVRADRPSDVESGYLLEGHGKRVYLRSDIEPLLKKGSAVQAQADKLTSRFA